QRPNGTYETSGVRDADLAALARLVCLASIQRDNDALSHTLNVRAINCTELRPTKGTRESNQQERTVATIFETGPQTSHHSQDVGFNGGSHSTLRMTVHATNSPHGHFDQLCRRWRGYALGGVSLGDCGQPTGQGRNREDRGVGDEVLGN